jgi:hypothetical protein
MTAMTSAAAGSSQYQPPVANMIAPVAATPAAAASAMVSSKTAATDRSRSPAPPSPSSRSPRRTRAPAAITSAAVLSTGPFFVEKVIDVAGLYHNPPERAVVLCIDEKSQIQALDRSQPMLPMMPGMPERRTHDYLRHGITSLFAAFNIADGTVISQLHRRHRAIEFKKFLARHRQGRARRTGRAPGATTTSPTTPPRSRPGSPATRVSMSTSPRSVRRG